MMPQAAVTECVSKMRLQEKETLCEAKGILMERNHMTGEKAYRYLQKRSMENGVGIVEMAQMVLLMR